MIVYCVQDETASSDDYYCRNLSEARKWYADLSAGSIVRIETVEPTKDGVISMLNRNGFVIKQEVIESK